MKNTMRTLVKTTIIFIMALAFCLSLAGCGAGNDEDKAVIGSCTVTVQDQIQEEEFDVCEGDSLYDILKKTDLAISAEDTGNGLAIEAIAGVANGDKGETSGWIFTVNDEMPMDYCDKVQVNDGDVIVWTFVEGM